MTRNTLCNGNIIRKGTCIALVLMAFVVGSLLLINIKSVYAHQHPKAGGVRLAIGTFLSGGITSTAFILTNEGREPFRTTPVCTNYSRLVIVSPDGTRMERFSWKDGIPPVVVESGTSQVWSLNLAEMQELKDPGTYRVTWKIGEVESEEAAVVRVAEKRNGE